MPATIRCARRGRPHPRWRAATLLALTTSLTLVGCGTHNPAAAPPQPAPPATSTTETPRPVPTSIDVASIGARSSLVPLGLNPDRTIEVPPVTQPLQAGWYEFGPSPGQPGPAVILGHIDGDHQQGIFWRLHDVKPGDKVVIGRQNTTPVTFTVTKVDQIAKNAFPTNAVYGDTPDPELRLITCGGAFDTATHNYLDNIIVYASLST